MNVGAVLRTVWAAQHLDCLQSRRLNQTEECADTATLRARRITNAINIDGYVSARQSTYKHSAQRRACTLQVNTRLFVDNLRDDFGRTLEDLTLGNDVDLCVDFARIGDESCFGGNCDLFGDGSEFENYADGLGVTAA